MIKRIHRQYRKARYIVYRETIVDPVDHLLTFIGGFAGIGLVGFIHSFLPVTLQDQFFLIGSFGASAVLVYGVPNSPLAQPRNLIGGHVLSAIVGVTFFRLLGDCSIPWLAPALAVATAIVLMQISKTLHPPGGATALIATIGSEKVQALGYVYVISPVFSGVMILLLIALVVNNLHSDRRYPVRRRKR